MPPNPTGAYRALWQLCDHLLVPRMYPSALMQCAGRTIAGDRWYHNDLVVALSYLQGSTVGGVVYDTNAISRSTMQSEFFFGGGNICSPGFLWRWMWWWHLVDSTTGEMFITTTDAYTSGFPSMNMKTGAVYNLAAAPWRNDPNTFGYLWMCHGSPGPIWHNAI